MNKYLVYTISDLRESSINCIDLLYQSLIQLNNNFDFYVITNNINYNNFTFSNNYNIIYDDVINSSYIGWLKYTDKLPDNYEYYFYLDSDILCYENLENLISNGKNISLVKEVENLMSYEWFSYPFASIDDKCIFNAINGINAGSFVFTNKDFLKQVLENKYKSIDIDKADIEYQAKFEQSCFNHACFNFLLNKEYHDITSLVQLRPNGEINEKKIYHFCNWQGFMDGKYSRMKGFHEKYINVLNIKTKKNNNMINKEYFYEIVKPFTMTSFERINALYDALEYIRINNIQGDFVECGVWKGGNILGIALYLYYHNMTDRKIWLYDTFTGMTSPEQMDIDLEGNNAIDILQRPHIMCYASLNEVKNNIMSVPFPQENINYIIGDIVQTLDNINNVPSNIALLRLDTDWYQSTKKELDILYPKLVQEGVLIVDDYGHWKGSKKAVDEYFEGKNVNIEHIDYTGIRIIKNEDN